MLNMSPYLAFNGQARDALEFYHGIFGGDLGIMTHGDYHHPDPALAEQVMHGQLETPGFVLMASDHPEGKAPRGEGNTTLCVWGDDVETGRTWFEGLLDGATLRVEFKEQMWGDVYGELEDKFGVVWAVNVSPAKEEPAPEA